MADKRPHSPDPDAGQGSSSSALVKRQRTDEGQLIIGSVTKDVSEGSAAAAGRQQLQQRGATAAAVVDLLRAHDARLLLCGQAAGQLSATAAHSP